MFSELSAECPNTEWLIDHMTTIPVHLGLGKSEVQYICDSLEDTYKEINVK